MPPMTVEANQSCSLFYVAAFFVIGILGVARYIRRPKPPQRASLEDYISIPTLDNQKLRLEQARESAVSPSLASVNSKKRSALQLHLESLYGNMPRNYPISK